MNAIDFHTHAFPDSLAGRAVPLIEEMSGVAPVLDGTIPSLLESMDDAGIERSVICSIATKPEQFDSIMQWSGAIASDRIIPFPSVYPGQPKTADQVAAVADAGFKGVKIHPYYQDFDLDDPRIYPLFEVAQASGLIVVCHTGYDVSFERVRRADPVRIRNVLDAFPRLKFVTTHLGAWEDWDLAREHLVGRPVYMETSFAMELLGPARSREILLDHPKEFILFGTDSPWTGQKATMQALLDLDLGSEREERLFHRNAEELLGLA